MRKVRKFLRLPAHEKLLLLQALLLVIGVRLGLWVLSFRALYQRARQLSPRRGARSTLAPQRLAWAVRVTSRLVPEATCLTQALAGQVLFAWHGYPATLHIGVGRGASGEFVAHAWLQHAGQTLLGGKVDHYQPLLALGGELQ